LGSRGERARIEWSGIEIVEKDEVEVGHARLRKRKIGGGRSLACVGMKRKGRRLRGRANALLDS